MRSSLVRTGVVLTTIATAGAVAFTSSAQAAPVFRPDLVGEALTLAAVPDVSGTVPAGVCSASFIVRGGGGSGLSLAAQSYPGQTTGSLTVTAGETVLLKTGTTADGVTGGLGGFATGGNGFTVGTDFGYGGGAASGFLLNGTVIAVAGGGGGASNDNQGNGRGGAGGGGTSGAGQNGTSLGSNTALGGALGSSTAPNGQNGLTTLKDGTGSNPNGGGGGGGGWNGGQGGVYGGSGGGGSNYVLASAPGMTITANGSYGAVASGYAGVAFNACAIPSAITSVSVTPNGTSAELSFLAAVDNGTPVTGYQYSLDGSSWNSLSTSGSSTLTATVSSLSLSTAYTVQVRPVYLTADIVSNAVANGGPGRGVTSYVTATSQAFTTLAQNRSTALAETAAPADSGLLTTALGFFAAGLALVMVSRRKVSGLR